MSFVQLSAQVLSWCVLGQSDAATAGDNEQPFDVVGNEVDADASVDEVIEVGLWDGLGLAYIMLGVMAVVCIHWGSKISISSENESEQMKANDAYMFPLMGSGVLFGLYVFIKFVSKEWVNFLLSAYFTLLGAFAVTGTISPFFSIFFPKTQEVKDKDGKVVRKRVHHYGGKANIPLMGEADLSFSIPDVFSFFISLAIAIWYYKEKHWIANNILGISFSVQGIANLSLGSWKTGAILLSGLFVYDVFWVFGTDVMVTVAKNFQAPIKVVFPRDLFADKLQFSMLGLGDIVIPGIFVALMLRFDEYLWKSTGSKGSMSTPYYNAVLAAYTAGLVTTIYIMHTFEAAQPALLYLVPFCLGTSLLVAATRGQVSEMVNYSEEEEEEEEKDEAASKEEKKKK